MLAGLGYVARTWYRYGSVAPDDGRDPLLDRFMPTYEVAEHHETRVRAPADITYAAAREMDLDGSGLVRAIFRAREVLLGSHPPDDEVRGPLLTRVLELGWGILAEEPGREIVLGTVTRPWEADVEFRSVAPNEFATFDTPGYVRIAWTLVVEPRGATEPVFRTETRVATTDASSRARFRRYWLLVRPGILLIRRESLRLVRADAEQRYREAGAPAR